MMTKHGVSLHTSQLPWDGQIRHFRKCEGTTIPKCTEKMFQCVSKTGQKAHLLLTITIITNSGRMIKPNCDWLRIDIALCNTTTWALKVVISAEL